MAIDRGSLETLRDLIADASLTLETAPDLPQNRTANCRESPSAALALADDLLKQHGLTAAAVLGGKGGGATTRRILGESQADKTMNSGDILIYGAGGLGRETAAMIEQIADAGAKLRCVGFIDDSPAAIGRIIDDLPVYSLDLAHDKHPQAFVVSSIGSTRVRKLTMDKASAIGFKSTALVHPAATISHRLVLEPGSIVCTSSFVSVNCRVGRHAYINVGASIGHDAIIGDFVNINPGVRISGFVTIGEGAYLGTNASLIQGNEHEPLTIGPWAVIGAGAVVLKNVEPGTTAVGVPARIISKPYQTD